MTVNFDARFSRETVMYLVQINNLARRRGFIFQLFTKYVQKRGGLADLLKKVRECLFRNWLYFAINQSPRTMQLSDVILQKRFGKVFIQR